MILFSRSAFVVLHNTIVHVLSNISAAIAQLGERQTEDLKVPDSIPGLGTIQFCVSQRNAPGSDRIKDLVKHQLTV